MDDFQFKILIILFVFILLIICISSYYYTKWLDINHNNKGRREISIVDLSVLFFVNFLASIMMFFIIITGYAMICINIGLINDELYDLNEYLSFIPLVHLGLILVNIQVVMETRISYSITILKFSRIIL